MYENDIKIQKRTIVDMVHDTGIAAHMSPTMAMMEIFNVLLRDIMTIKEGIDSENSDKLVLSNGHTALALYAVYEYLGLVSREEFWTYKKRNSRLAAHQDRHHTPGTIISTGSLGHGLPNAIGVAYAWKLQSKSNQIYVTVGDGELNEGSIWEAAIYAARMHLDNLCCIIDDNKSTEYMPIIAEKFKAFGWETIEIDGHNEEEIRNALKNKPSGAPYAVVANTVKGKGVHIFEEDHAKWHENKISDEDYALIIEDLI